LRRSVKYHFELNARKDIHGSEPDPIARGEFPKDNAKQHGRFSIDIDAEGLTKVNIPASSETGNVPILGRYLVTKDAANSGAFKDSSVNGEKVDVRFAQFGALDGYDGYYSFAGQKLASDGYEYLPKSIHEYVAPGEAKPPKTTNNLSITVGTAFHDMIGETASSVFGPDGYGPKIPLNGTTTTLPLKPEVRNVAETLNNPALPNAGGRSLHLNLDGSLEASIGADTVDRKSMMLDLAGGTVSHFGRDANGRSIIHQSDGDIIIQVGGHGVNDSRFPNDGYAQQQPGRVEVHFVRPGKAPHRILIDEGGITIESASDMVLWAEDNLSIHAGANILINGENIGHFGTVDKNTRVVKPAEKLLSRDGR
jgi:hypothetical protein